MDRIKSLKAAESKVLGDIQSCISRLKGLAGQPFETPGAGIALLQSLRKEAYEDLNQIQHEHLIIRAAEWLLAEGVSQAKSEWYWNPRQTGDHNEPDLRGVVQGVTIVSAEVTTSEKPVGTIDSGMRKTLAKLARFDGAKFYFVRTETMSRRAKTKINKEGWLIQVVNLGVQQIAP